MSETSSEGARVKKDLLKGYQVKDLGINAILFKPEERELEATKAKKANLDILFDSENVLTIALKDNLKEYDKIPVEKKQSSSRVAKTTRKKAVAKEDKEEKVEKTTKTRKRKTTTEKEVGE